MPTDAARLKEQLVNQGMLTEEQSAQLQDKQQLLEAVYTDRASLDQHTISQAMSLANTLQVGIGKPLAQ